MAPLVSLVQLEKNSQLSNLREQVPFLELTALSEPGHLEGAEEVTFFTTKKLCKLCFLTDIRYCTTVIK